MLLERSLFYSISHEDGTVSGPDNEALLLVVGWPTNLYAIAQKGALDDPRLAIVLGRGADSQILRSNEHAVIIARFQRRSNCAAVDPEHTSRQQT